MQLARGNRIHITARRDVNKSVSVKRRVHVINEKCGLSLKGKVGRGGGGGGTAQEAQEAVVCCFFTWLFSLQTMASADPDPTCSPANSGGFSFSISDSLQLTRRWNPLTFVVVVVTLAVCWHTASPRCTQNQRDIDSLRLEF